MGRLSGGRQLPAKPRSGASVLGTGVAASPGAWSLDTEPRGPPTRPLLYLGTGGYGKHNTLWTLEGISVLLLEVDN